MRARDASHSPHRQKAPERDRRPPFNTLFPAFPKSKYKRIDILFPTRRRRLSLYPLPEGQGETGIRLVSYEQKSDRRTDRQTVRTTCTCEKTTLRRTTDGNRQGQTRRQYSGFISRRRTQKGRRRNDNVPMHAGIRYRGFSARALGRLDSGAFCKQK